MCGMDCSVRFVTGSFVPLTPARPAGLAYPDAMIAAACFAISLARRRSCRLRGAALRTAGILLLAGCSGARSVCQLVRSTACRDRRPSEPRKPGAGGELGGAGGGGGGGSEAGGNRGSSGAARPLGVGDGRRAGADRRGPGGRDRSLTQALPYPRHARRPSGGSEQACGRVGGAKVMERIAAEADARRVYWRRYRWRRAAEVTGAGQAGAGQQVGEVIDARARVGNAGQADQLRVSRLRLADLEQELDRLRQAAAGELDAMMKRWTEPPTSAFCPSRWMLDWSPAEVDREAMIGGPERQPGRAGPASARRGLRQQFKLARLERRPDFRIGVQYAAVADDGLAGSANGDDQFAVTGVTLPFFSRQVRRRSARRSAASARP